MSIPASDKNVLRELGRRKAELAALPVMKQTADLYRRIDALELTRPAVQVSQAISSFSIAPPTVAFGGIRMTPGEERVA